MPHTVRGRARAQCVAVGTALPERRLTNAELERMVETSDDWIVSRTGIRERRIAPPDQGLSHLAIPAARRCLDHAGVQPAEIDGIIVATITGDYVMPSTANLVQHGIGAANAWGFDLLNACNGFVAALSAATAYIESGHARRILVIGGDIMSSVVDYRDRNTCILFGDGCGAVLVEAGSPDGHGVLGFEMHSDGGGGGDLIIPSSGSAMVASAAVLERGDQFVKQNGIVVFQQAIRRMAEVCDSLLTTLGLSGADVDLLVPHQANRRIIEPTAKRLGLSADKVVINIDRMANTTGATIPLALADALADGRLKSGSRVLLAAFGGGLTWGACYLTWGRT
ncbi:MAG: ketoacyl-ACP synthase III [Planctomycetes bacterium]|nr:ketoacyl-ACP synthase III [Planctomycetota bacterium]